MWFIQTPGEIPTPHNNDPIDLTSTSDILIYIVIPVLLLILYILWRRGRRNS